MRRFSKAVTSLVVVITLIIGLVAVGKSDVRAAGGAPEFLGEVVAWKSEDPAIMARYTPTQIINGNFDSHPNLYPYTVEEIYENENINISHTVRLFINKNGTITTGSALGTNIKSTIADIVREDGTNGFIENWKTSETNIANNGNIESHFEWLNSYYLVNIGNKDWPNSAYGTDITFKINNGTQIEGCVELNQENQGTLYQDLRTTSRDVIMWSLEHAARKEPAEQKMRVIIGTPKDDGSGNSKSPEAAKPSGTVEVIEANISNPTVFIETGVDSSSGYFKDGYAKTDSTKWLGFKDVPSTGIDWKKAEGIYIVPDSQTLTRFAFQSIGGGTRGNFLDDVVFDTLAGNLKSIVDSDGNIKITGYWGDLPNASDELIYELFGDDSTNPIATVLLNMKDVTEEGPFEAIITKQKLTEGGLTEDQIEKIQKTANLDKNDVIPKDYYSQVNVGATIPYKVTFDTQKTEFDNPDIQFKSASEAEKASSPSEYVKDQLYVGSDGKIYKFKGWYEDKSATIPYNFDTSVTKDITLYAGWETVTDAALVFDSNGQPDAKDIPDIQTSEGASNWAGTKPATDPSLSGFIFDGWYESATPSSTDKPYNFNAVIPDGTVKTLYAKWTPKKSTPPSGGGYTPPSTIPTKTHKVEFETPVGPKPDTQSGIKPGQTAKDPTSFKIGDEIDGKVFEGWFKDPEFKIPYDFNEKVDGDIKVYAKWIAKETSTQVPIPEQKEVKIEFESEIGVTPKTQVTTPGNTATDPGAPLNPDTLKPGMVIDGYRFEGWYLDKNLTIPYVFGTAVNDDIVLYAKWTAVGVGKSPKTGDMMSYYWLALSMAGLIAFFGRAAFFVNPNTKDEREEN